jgi:hypothetical protein
MGHETLGGGLLPRKEKGQAMNSGECPTVDENVSGFVPDATAGAAAPGDLPGVIAVLGELGPGAILTEEGVSRLFGRHVASVKRAVQRGELPPPCRLFGSNAWTARSLISHIEQRLSAAAKEADAMARKLARLTP